jgi:hypothetical protein
MRTIIAIAALVTGVLMFASVGHAQFSNASLSGPYGFALNGTVTFTGGQPAMLPTWATGTVTADGAGSLTTIESVFNVGGCAVVRQTGSGTYAVNANGLGQASGQMITSAVDQIGTVNAPCPALDPALVPATSTFNFEFSIDDSGLNLVATSWEGPAGPLAAFGASGRGTPQEAPSAP